MPPEATSTVYHFGFAQDDRAVQRTYDSRESFRGRSGPVGNFAVKPVPHRPLTKAPETDEELLELAFAVRRDQAESADGKGVMIGGALVRVCFTSDGQALTEEMYRFED